VPVTLPRAYRCFSDPDRLRLRRAPKVCSEENGGIALAVSGLTVPVLANEGDAKPWSLRGR